MQMRIPDTISCLFQRSFIASLQTLRVRFVFIHQNISTCLAQTLLTYFWWH